MDLIYMSESLVDMGVIQNSTLDYEASTNPDSCNFEISAMVSDSPLVKGDYIYCEGDEYGGRVDAIQVDTAKKTIKATGRSWRGILASKVIVPPTNQAYKIVSGNVGDILQELIDEYGLGDLFKASSSELSITSYQFYRYTDLYSGLIKLCEVKGFKLVLRWARDKMELSIVPRNELTEANAITSDLFDFKITTSTSVNHVIGLGRGELVDRWVVHKYLDSDGKVSDVQTFTGIAEIAETYEETNAETIEELAQKVSDKLLNQKQSDKLEITSYNLNCDVGDKIQASDRMTGISITRYVTDKILTIEKEITKIQYKVGAI